MNTDKAERLVILSHLREARRKHGLHPNPLPLGELMPLAQNAGYAISVLAELGQIKKINGQSYMITAQGILALEAEETED